jgi:hypothetical protein
VPAHGVDVDDQGNDTATDPERITWSDNRDLSLIGNLKFSRRFYTTSGVKMHPYLNWLRRRSPQTLFSQSTIDTLLRSGVLEV